MNPPTLFSRRTRFPSRILTGLLALLLALFLFVAAARATVTVTISGTEISVTGDTSADRSQFSVNGGGYLELNGKSDLDGDGSSNDILVSSITRFEYSDTNDEVVFNGSNAFNFHALNQLNIPEADALEIYADLDLSATSGGTPSSAGFSANLYRAALISGATIKTAQGDFDIMANGQGSGLQPGVAVFNSTIESIGVGNVMLTGTGCEADGSNGVVVDQSSTISTTSGGVTLNGTGGGELNDNLGVRISSSCSIFSAAGDVSITGTGGGANGGARNHGAMIEGYLFGGGNQIRITGMANSDGPTNRGVEISGATIEGPANIEISGLGQNGDGLRIDGSTTIFTSPGMVQLSGSVTSTGMMPGHGVVIDGSPTHIESELGSIQISGNSGDGDQSMGILISGGSILRSITAPIMLNGSASGMILSDGVRLEDTAQIASLTGDIDILASSDFGRGIYADGLGIDIGGHTAGWVRIITDDYEVRSPVTSQSFVQIFPETDGLEIEVGSATGPVNLEQDEIDLILAPELIIGDRSNATGDITIDTVDFPMTTTVEADASITVNRVNWTSSTPGDLFFFATGDVDGGSSSISHLKADNLEFEVDGEVGLSNPLLIDSNGLKVVAADADFGGNGAFDYAHFDLEGTATFRNSFRLSVNAQLFIALNRNSGTIVSVLGQVNLGNANLSYAVSPLAGFGSGDVVALFNNDGGDATLGGFDGIAEGDTIGSSPLFEVSYAGGSGNDVTIAVP